MFKTWTKTSIFLQSSDSVSDEIFFSIISKVFFLQIERLVASIISVKVSFQGGRLNQEISLLQFENFEIHNLRIRFVKF